MGCAKMTLSVSGGPILEPNQADLPEYPLKHRLAVAQIAVEEYRNAALPGEVDRILVGKTPGIVSTSSSLCASAILVRQQ